MSRPHRPALSRQCGPRCYVNESDIFSLRLKNAYLVNKNVELKKDIALLKEIIIQCEEQFVTNSAGFMQYILNPCQQYQCNDKMARLVQRVRTPALISRRFDDSGLKNYLYEIFDSISRIKELTENKFQPVFTDIAQEPEETESESEQNGSTNNIPATEIKSKRVKPSRIPTKKKNRVPEKPSPNRNTKLPRTVRAARPKGPLKEPNLISKLRRD